MNKPQKFFVLLWGLVSLVTVLVTAWNFFTIKNQDWMVFAGFYLLISAALLGMVWVLADKR